MKLTGKEKLHFLELKSDIDIEDIGDGLVLKKVTPDDWSDWFNVKLTFSDSELKLQKTGSGGLYINAFTTDTSTDLTGFKFYQNNYVVFCQGENMKATVEKFDQALRLFSTGRSGISRGITSSAVDFFYPKPGWMALPLSTLNKNELKSFTKFSNELDQANLDKKKLLINRYRNSTQTGSSGIEDYNRFIDLITILEILFVPDGAQGEISYKLRMRSAKIVAEALSKPPSEAKTLIKKFYDMRSKIVHGGGHDIISEEEWGSLCTICRTAIIKYLFESEKFGAEALDAALV